MDKQLGWACLGCSTTDEKDYSAVGGEELNNRSDMNEGELLIVKPLRSTFGLVQVMRGYFGTFPQIRPLPCPFQTSAYIDSTAIFCQS